jgi:acetyl-CoA carboxylase biotin carboxylase subunit
LIANRGEIAVRIIRACQELGFETVLAVSEADRESLPASLADRVVCIGPARSNQSYLNIQAIIATALGTGSDAIHPGYGFLSESPDLAKACVAAGLTFVGPTADHMRKMGNKIQARMLARQIGVPTLPGSEKISSAEHAVQVASQIGFPVMIKAAAGGGGRGMKVVAETRDLPQAFMSASAEAGSAFGDPTLYLERFIANARHIEVQILGDCFGNVIHLGERDCSLQRRHQKIVEEAPAPGIAGPLRKQIQSAAVTLARNIGYENAGTVEFLFDETSKNYYFLEMNTRIQVEHPVTEMLTGIDIVQEQFRIAAGEALRFTQSDITFRGHVIECRLNAEIPERNFRPNAGRITRWHPPVGPNVRLDTHCYAGYSVPVFYDSLLAKLIVCGINRNEALHRMQRALQRFAISGVGTTLPFLEYIMCHPDFESGEVSTHLVDDMILQFSAPIVAEA